MVTIEDVVSAVWSPVWSTTSFFIVLVVVLSVRPQGLFGKRTGREGGVRTAALPGGGPARWPSCALFPARGDQPRASCGIGFSTLIFMACTTSWNMFSGLVGLHRARRRESGTAIGAYTMALASIDWHFAPGAGMFWLVPARRARGHGVAVPVGWVALRVRRHTFVVITIALFFIAQLAAINAGFTGGTSGLFLPFIPWNERYYNVPFYYVALAILVVATLLAAGVRR